MQIAVKEISTQYDLNEDWEFECQHLNTEYEDAVTNYLSFSGVSEYTYKVKVCSDCGVDIEGNDEN